MKKRFLNLTFYLLLFSNLCSYQAAEACTFCFGDPNSDLAKGVKSAVLLLLGIVTFVLGAVVCVIVTWTGRARKLAARDEKDGTSSPTPFF